jgi:hypothetical protein
MGRGSEGEDCLIKNMLEDDDVVGGDIETPITFVISGVFEEDTTSGWGPICGQLERRGWDRKHSRTRTSAHMRVRHRKGRHTDMRR